MAGIGIRLNKIFGQGTIGMNLAGYAYSVNVTIMPMLAVIACLLAMYWAFGLSASGYHDRELFACTVLYVFIFGLLCVSPLNAVISRYLSDVIFEERYEDIMPCFWLGLALEACVAAAVGIPFCLREHLVGGVGVWYVFCGFAAFAALVLTFYTMIYLSICKAYGRISAFFALGMLCTFLVAAALIWLVGVERTRGMLVGLVCGFTLTATLEVAQVRSYFRVSSATYAPVIRYLRDYWQLVVCNFLYTLGLFVHNFVFWGASDRMVLVDTFVCNQPYDMATCLAMFTSLSSSTIFIALVEMRFHERYTSYFNAVIGGTLDEIERAKHRMLAQLRNEVTSLERIQFAITVVLYLVFCAFAPRLGITGYEIQIYRLMAAGYFVVFLMYANIILLYYYSDHAGLVATTASFCAVTLVGALVSRSLTPPWFGLGLWVGAIVGWTVSYARLRWVERNLDAHVFCRGQLVAYGRGRRPSDVVYRARADVEEDGGARDVAGHARSRVLFVINTLGRAGAETAMIALMRRLLARNDVDVSVFVLANQGELVGELPPEVRLLNGPTYSRESVLTEAGRRTLARTALRCALRRAAGLRLLPYLVRNGVAMARAGRVQPDKLLWRVLSDGAPRTDEEFDLAVAFLEGGSTYYVADHVRARHKVAFVHIDYAQAGYTRDLDGSCYDAYDRILAVSERGRQGFVAVYPELADKVAVMENVLDVHDVRRRAEMPGGFDDGYAGARVLTVGRLVPQKGLDVAVRALAELRRRGVEARWYVLGEGDGRRDLQRLIDEEGLRDDFALMGAEANPNPFMAQCTVYVQPSRFEGRSLALREACAVGCAIVASDYPGNRETVTDGVNGLLCALDPTDLADKVQWLIEHPEERARLGRAARASADGERADITELTRFLDEGRGDDADAGDDVR